MFRRLWTGLPETPKFPANLEKLGYFVNEEDQIRNIQDSKYYYKYFIDRNTYYNDCQRFSFNTAVQRIVLDRLAVLGLRPIRLPLGAREDEPHVLVLATEDLATADRVLLFVGETAQDLGILAHRVIGGGGGINEGSIVAMVQKIQDAGTDAKENLPAVLIANPGELFWWPEARRSLSLPAVEGMPRLSAAHLSPRRIPGQNTVPGHETADAHVTSVFKDLLTRGGCSPGGGSPRITAIAIAGGADALETFLDQPKHWRRWGPHMDSLVVLGGLYEEHHIQTDAFRSFLRQRGRAYIASEAAVNTPVAGPDGNSQAVRATRFGCPVHSAGTSWLTELMFIEAQTSILAWGEAVARDRNYTNPQIDISYAEKIMGVDETTWANYKEEGEEGAPKWGDLVMEDADAGKDKENQEVSGPAHEAVDDVSEKGVNGGNGVNGANGVNGVNGAVEDAVEYLKDKLADISLEEN